MSHTPARQVAASAEADGKSVKRAWVIHPFLFAVFPVAFVYAQNIRQFSAGVMVLPAAALLLCTGVLWALLWLLARNAVKAGLLTSLFLLLFFSYGPVQQGLPFFRLFIFGVLVRPKLAVFVLWVLLMPIGAWFILRSKRSLRKFTTIVNVAAATLVLISVFNILVYEIGSRARTEVSVDATDVETSETGTNTPDIYYIIMDAYGRQDLLERLYAHDNSGFIAEMEKRGFRVPRRALSNYAHTLFCLSSTLNLDYVDNLLDIDEDSTDRLPLMNLTRYSKVYHFLKKRGYTFVAFGTGAAIAEMTNADIFLTPGWFADEFHNALLDMTPLWVIYQRLSPAEQHRRRLLFGFAQLEEMSVRPSPKFVFAHFLAPHHPIVFDRSGGPVDLTELNTAALDDLDDQMAKEYRHRYREELIYINRRLLEAVDAILAKSAAPPVIIIQGDHGPRSLLRSGHVTPEAIFERHAIFAAYFLPGVDAREIPDDFTPVNTFRVVLNHYFGGRDAMLENRHYYSLTRKPYAFTDVTDLLRGKEFPRP